LINRCHFLKRTKYSEFGSGCFIFHNYVGCMSCLEIHVVGQPLKSRGEQYQNKFACVIYRVGHQYSCIYAVKTWKWFSMRDGHAVYSCSPMYTF
jgi:hypothetical protein